MLHKMEQHQNAHYPKRSTKEFPLPPTHYPSPQGREHVETQIIFRPKIFRVQASQRPPNILKTFIGLLYLLHVEVEGSTLGGGKDVGREDVGQSFSSHIQVRIANQSYGRQSFLGDTPQKKTTTKRRGFQLAVSLYHQTRGTGPPKKTSQPPVPLTAS